MNAQLLIRLLEKVDGELDVTTVEGKNILGLFVGFDKNYIETVMLEIE